MHSQSWKCYRIASSTMSLQTAHADQTVYNAYKIPNDFGAMV